MYYDGRVKRCCLLYFWPKCFQIVVLPDFFTFRIEINATRMDGGVGIFGFADFSNFCFGFSVFPLKNCGFSVLVSCAVSPV